MIARAGALACAVLVAVSTWGCAALSGGSSSTSVPCADALGDPARLVELAREADRANKPDLSYRYLALIHILHPESAQNREMFVHAARAYRISWAPHRTELDSIWTTSEPLFLFGWLAGFFQDSNEFPQDQMNALFVGMNYQLFRDFLAYAKNRPHVDQWTITAEKDNGIIEKVTGVRDGSPPA